MDVSENTYLRGVASYSGLLATLAIMFDKDYHVYGMSVYPFKYKITKNIARFVVTNAVSVTLREQYHKENLVNIGIPVDNVRVVCDPAFSLDRSLIKV